MPTRTSSPARSRRRPCGRGSRPRCGRSARRGSSQSHVASRRCGSGSSRP
jgi:hypothetical protein